MLMERESLMRIGGGVEEKSLCSTNITNRMGTKPVGERTGGEGGSLTIYKLNPSLKRRRLIDILEKGKPPKEDWMLDLGSLSLS